MADSLSATPHLTLIEPGDVMNEAGDILTQPYPGGTSIGRLMVGRVIVTARQAEVAAAYGWAKIAGSDDEGMVQIERGNGVLSVGRQKWAADAQPHPRWKRGDKSDRHPQAEYEWNYKDDPVGEALARSIRRLNVAGDYDDPRAPDQMALVLRIDVIRLMHDWQHKNAAWEAWRERRGSAEALRAVRQELWVDYCLGMGRTDCDPAPFNSRPHIRIIDEALAGAPMGAPTPPLSFPAAWEAFTFAHQRVMDEHSGTEPTKARQAGVQAIVDLLSPGAL